MRHHFRKRPGWRAAAIALLPILAACTTPGAGLPPLPLERASVYQLGPGDQLRVTVFNDNRLSGDYRINDTGAIALPLLGTVQAAGQTTEQIEREVERTLRERNLFNQPSVAVEVAEYRPVYILGMVERGGQTPYQPGMSVLSAVAVMGGFNYRAVTERVSITRIGPDGVPHEYLGTRQSLLQPRDVVTVFERGL